MVESMYCDRCIIGRCNNRSSIDNDDTSYDGALLEDIVVEILCRLPAKCLIRFKCVSRCWYYLISNVVVPRISPLPLRGLYFWIEYRSTPHPVIYYKPMPNPPQIYDTDDKEFSGFWPFCCSTDEPPLGSLPFFPSPEDLLDCCNGLFLFINRSLKQYYLWGRKTSQFVMIPLRAHFKHGVFAALAFNPHESVHYKVIRFPHPLRGSPPGISPLDIFYSETGKWVEYHVHYKPPVNSVTLVRHCINLGGSLYRLSMSRHLLRYDLEVVNVTAIELLPVRSSTVDDKTGCIGISLGRLYHARRDGPTLLIWMLCDSHCGVGEWVLMRSICVQELARHPLISDFLPKFPATSGFEPLTFHPISLAVFLWTPDICICYHHDNNELEVIYCGTSARVTTKKLPHRVFPYSTCLVPLRKEHWPELSIAQ